MFAPGEKEVSRLQHESQDRRPLAFVRTGLTDADVEAHICQSLPEAEDAPPLLLPPGWEQRCDDKSLRIFFVDHNTCTTTWEDPRTTHSAAATEEDSELTGMNDPDAEGVEDKEGAMADLKVLSLGLVLPKADEQLVHAAPHAAAHPRLTSAYMKASIVYCDNYHGVCWFSALVLVGKWI